MSEGVNKTNLTLRRVVREILSALPKGRKAPVKDIVGLINNETSHVADEDSVRDALAWNHDRGWVQSTKNHELDRFEWELTADGRKQEGLAE
jgi:hypothetical protein